MLPAQYSKNIEISIGPGLVMQEDPKSANFMSLGGLVPEIWSKNRFLTIFDPKMKFFKNSVKSKCVKLPASSFDHLWSSGLGLI